MGQPAPGPGETPISYARDENLGANFQISQGTHKGVIGFNGSDQRTATQLTASLTWSYNDLSDVKDTDDFSGFFWRVTYGIGGIDQEVDIDPNTGLFVTMPTVKWSLYACYGPPFPTASNPTPTTPDIRVKAMVALGTRPSAPTSPTRTLRFAIPAAPMPPNSATMQIPTLARALFILGGQGTYQVTFYSSPFGQPSTIMTVPVGTNLSALVSIPLGALSFSVAAAAGESVVMAVFQLAL
jgi:hypothetical protein